MSTYPTEPNKPEYPKQGGTPASYPEEVRKDPGRPPDEDTLLTDTPYGSGTDPQMVIDAVELGRRQGSREAQVEAKVDKRLEIVRHKEGGPMGTATGPPYDWAQEESGQRSHPLTRMQRFNAWRDR